MEEQIQKGAKKVKKFFDGILDVQATLTVEKRFQRAEINILADGVHLTGDAATDDLYKSIDVAFSRIQTQLLKYKQKLRNHRTRRKTAPANLPGLGIKVEVLSGPDLEYGKQNPEIIVSRNYEIKPMSVEEAAMQMDLIEKDVLVFVNDDNDRLNVLWRRRDGNYELIDPDLRS
jgi:putative sigma-54 modulation protein